MYNSIKVKVFGRLILILCLFGCGEELQLLHPVLQPLTAEVEIHRSLPAEVLAAMRIQADNLAERLGYVHWAAVQKDGGWWSQELFEFSQELIEKGYVDLETDDCHALQLEYYTRYIDAGGIAIVGPAEVEDAYYHKARVTILLMTAKRPELKERLLSKHGRFYMVLFKSFLRGGGPPEYLHSKFKRNTCTTDIVLKSDPAVTGLCWGHISTPDFLGVQYNSLSTFIHEFAHGLQSEMERLDPDFKSKLRKAYDAWPKPEWWTHHADYPDFEWWADRVALWMTQIGPNNGYETHADFFDERPLTASLLAEWFPQVTENPYNYPLLLDSGKYWTEGHDEDGNVILRFEND